MVHKAVWIEQRPERVFPAAIRRVDTDGETFYVVRGAATRWANPALTARRETFRRVYGHVAAKISDYRASGASLEDLLNGPYRRWWLDQDYSLGLTKRLLVYHDRHADGGKLNRPSAGSQ